MQKHPKVGTNQGKSGNTSNRTANRDSQVNNLRSNKDKHAEEIPGKDYHHLFDLQDASKPRNVTVNYKF